MLDDIDVTGQKAHVPEYLSALFQESDRNKIYDQENEVEEVFYRASRETVLKRLDLMGCTDDACKRRFEEWREQTIISEEDFQREYGNADNIGEAKTLKALQKLDWNEWHRRVWGVLHTQYNIEVPDNFLDEIDRCMKDHDPSWLWFDGYNSLLSLRAIISACPEAKTVTLEIGELISGGWIEPDDKVCAEKINVVSARGQPVGPTIILAEGRSDITILKASISCFHPDLVDFVTFLDHSEFRVDGGASYVVKFLKAFAAARVPANIVAVFDNDAAGLAAYQDATALKLPPNMACMHLPDIELGRAYPTIGPQGESDADINGKACGIELYLGRTALSLNGVLRPVHWAGYNKQMATYQGEVDGKGAVQQVFLKEMKSRPENLKSTYPEMSLLWEEILQTAAKVGEASQNNARLPRGWY